MPTSQKTNRAQLPADWDRFRTELHVTPSAPDHQPDYPVGSRGEGVYCMSGPHGIVNVPLSVVEQAAQHGYTLTKDDDKQYARDYAAAHPPTPQQQGFFHSFANAGGRESADSR